MTTANLPVFETPSHVPPRMASLPLKPFKIDTNKQLNVSDYWYCKPRNDSRKRKMSYKKTQNEPAKISTDPGFVSTLSSEFSSSLIEDEVFDASVQIIGAGAVAGVQKSLDKVGRAKSSSRFDKITNLYLG